MQQRQLFELLKDYDCTIEYHPGKANVVANALSRKTSSSIAHLQVNHMEDFLALRGLNVELQLGQESALIATLHIRPVLRQRIQENQRKDQHLVNIQNQIQQGVETSFSI